MSRLFLFFFFLSAGAYGQVNRYFVSFKDKSNSIYSISNPLQFLSQKSLDRRARENFLVSEEDFPVNAGYVQQVKATGAQVYFSSRWLNGVLVQIDESLYPTIAALPCVKSVVLAGLGARLNGRVKAGNKFTGLSTSMVLANESQSQMIGLDRMHDDGYHGEGIDVAVFDAGFNGIDTLTAFKHLYQEGRIKDVFNFVQNTSDVYHGYPHGTWVLSIMAGNYPDRYAGGVTKANYFLYQTEDAFSEYRVEEYNWLFAAEKADSAGIDVINSSLGYFQFDDPSMDYTYWNMDGQTTVVARAARKAVERGIVVVNAAGNEGNHSWRYIISPADAMGVIACGGVNTSLDRVSFSSIGPSADGRVKPDVSGLAQGSVVIDTDGSMWAGNGTSFASPLVACLAVGLRQVFPKASGATIYSLIINSASQASQPDVFLGYGVPSYDQAKKINGDFHAYPNPADPSKNLKIDFNYPDGQIVSAALYNSCGQKVFESSHLVLSNSNPYVIELSPFVSGLYYLQVRTSTSTTTEKIVILN